MFHMFSKRVFTVFATVLTLVAGFRISYAANPWVQTFTPSRQLYVSPTGIGTGSQSSPMSMSKAISGAKPGDLYWLTTGTYTGFFKLGISGTATKPIVYRALPQNKVKINGAIEIKGAYTWIWGLEITDPTGIGAVGSDGVTMLAPGIHLINNVIHHHKGNNGIGAWDYGQQMVYGNIVYENGQDAGHPHNIYGQNQYSKFGYKYIVGNMFLDARLIDPGSYNVHVYSGSGKVTGFYLEKNIISNGGIIMGGNIPTTESVINSNYFYDSSTSFGYGTPFQLDFTNNYMGRTRLSLTRYWGTGEVVYNQARPTVFTGNELVKGAGKSGRILFFRTMAYTAPGVRVFGTPGIQSRDVFNNNKYTAPFVGEFTANGTHIDFATFAQWKGATAVAGNPFDVNSTEVPKPTAAKVFLIPNEYEPKRAYLAIYNWPRTSNVKVDLSSFLASGVKFSIYKPKSFGTSPVVTGTYSGPVSIPLGGAEFSAFVITSGS
jgi:hypothetical protein